MKTIPLVVLSAGPEDGLRYSRGMGRDSRLVQMPLNDQTQMIGITSALMRRKVRANAFVILPNAFWTFVQIKK